MDGILLHVVTIACFAVLAVVAFGLATFARGGEFSRRWSNRIMQLRVALQLVAVVLIVLVAWTLD